MDTMTMVAIVEMAQIISQGLAETQGGAVREISLVPGGSRMDAPVFQVPRTRCGSCDMDIPQARPSASEPAANCRSGWN